MANYLLKVENQHGKGFIKCNSEDERTSAIQRIVRLNYMLGTFFKTHHATEKEMIDYGNGAITIDAFLEEVKKPNSDLVNYTPDGGVEFDYQLPKDIRLAVQKIEHRANHSIVGRDFLALKNLVFIAQMDTGQARVIASFLASLYNGYDYKFNLCDFRAIDTELFLDCMDVLFLSRRAEKEIHLYIENGQAIWEKFIKQWGFTRVA